MALYPQGLLFELKGTSFEYSRYSCAFKNVTFKICFNRLTNLLCLKEKKNTKTSQLEARM